MKNTSRFLLISLLLTQLALPMIAETVVYGQAEEKLDSPSTVPLTEENIPLWKKIWKKPRVKKAVKIGGCVAAVFVLYVVTTTFFFKYKGAFLNEKDFFDDIKIRESQLLLAYIITIARTQTQILGAYFGLGGVREAWAENYTPYLIPISGNLPRTLTLGVDKGIRCIEENKPFFPSFRDHLKRGVNRYFNPTDSNQAN